MPVQEVRDGSAWVRLYIYSEQYWWRIRLSDKRSTHEKSSICYDFAGVDPCGLCPADLCPPSLCNGTAVHYCRTAHCCHTTSCHTDRRPHGSDTCSTRGDHNSFREIRTAC